VKNLADRLKSIEDSRVERAGEGSGAKNLWAVIVGVVALIATVVGLIAFFNK
jgi:hypothetical protein